MRIRNQILYKKHDPHKIKELQAQGKDYEAPPPPPPPFKSNSLLFNQQQNHNNNNKNKPNDNYEESPEPTEGFDNPAMYRTNPDSGFSDLNQIQCNLDNNDMQVQRCESVRPNSQASDDSDDSGFRSSRSGQYIHSASSSTGTGQENCGPGVAPVNSLQVHDSVPLFKPIKIHPNEMGRQPMVSYMNRNSSRHKVHKQRKPIPSSQHYNGGSTESQSQSNVSVINASQPLVATMPSLTFQGHSAPQQCNSVPYISKSINDVHGGRLHSIDSHVGPVPCAGHYGVKLCSETCSNRPNFHSQGFYSDSGMSQPNSLGYGSDIHNFGVMSSMGYLGGSFIDKGPINQEQLCYPLQYATHQTTLNNKIPLTSNIPGYTITSSSHIQHIDPDRGLSAYSMGSPLHGLSQPPQTLTITQAMVHRPYIEELSDPTLYSVV